MAPADAVPHRLAVLADDLTGAADAAGPFAARGVDVSVVLSSTVPQDAEVIAIVTDNRWRPAAEAAERTRDAVSRVRAWCPGMLLVKIDSTLRGRVREDILVALDAWGHGDAVATPAFPAQGRVVRQGTLIVHGEPTVARVADHVADGVRVVDAETHDDLLAVALGIAADGAVAVGSGGMARALAEVLVDEPRPPRLPHGPVTGVLLVVGTAHAATRGQVAAVLATGADRMVLTPSRTVPCRGSRSCPAGRPPGRRDVRGARRRAARQRRGLGARRRARSGCA